MATLTKLCKKEDCPSVRELPLSEFGKKSRMPDGLQPWCKTCTRASARAQNAAKRALRPAPYAPPEGFKLCTVKGCDEPEKPLTEFYDKSAQCKFCLSKKSKEKYAENSDEVNAQRRERYQKSPGVQQARGRKYKEENRDEINRRQREKYAGDEDYRGLKKTQASTWNIANPEKKSETRQLYYAVPENKVHKLASDAAWYAKNREEVLVKNRKKYAEDDVFREANLAASRVWREANPGQKAEVDRRWKDENSDRVLASTRLRNKRLQGVTIEFVDYCVIRARDKFCYLCGVTFQHADKTDVDHIIPLSRLELNPTHSYANCALTHSRCNRRKSNKTPDEYWAAMGISWELTCQ